MTTGRLFTNPSKLTDAGLRPTHPMSVVNEKGETKTVEIAGELPLTILVDEREVVTFYP